MVDEAINNVFYTMVSPPSNLSALTMQLGGKYILKDDCIRSCLIELQSFFDDSKININPEYRILMPFPIVLHVSSTTRHRIINVFWISMIFIPWINRQKEHRLSFA